MNNQPNNELKACPFCGEAGEYDSSHFTGRGIGPEYSGHSVYCSSEQCPYFTNALDGSIFDTKEEAYEAWNCRYAAAVAELPPSIEDAKQWKRETSGAFISPELEDYVAKLMSDYAMEVLARSGYFNGRDHNGE